MKKLITTYLLILLLSGNLFPKSTENLRIVSLTPSVTKQLLALGLKNYIVGCTKYSPLANNNSTKVSIVGEVTNVNIEAIVRLKPTIVFANSLTPSRIIEGLKNLKINVIVFKYPKSIKDIFDSFLKLGKITHREKLAEKIIEKSKKILKSIEMRARSFPKKKVFFILGSHPLYTAPKGTYIDDIIEKINCINIARNLKTGLISREFVLEKNPDVILIMDMGKIAQEELNYWKRFKNLNAVKNNKIFIINADRLGSPVLPDFVNLIGEIMKMVHDR